MFSMMWRQAPFWAMAFVMAFFCFSAATVQAESLNISQIDKKFDPETVTAKVGDTIVFVNDDKVAHNILISKIRYNSGLQKPGQSAELALDEAGTFKVRCGIHPKMKMTLEVK